MSDRDEKDKEAALSVAPKKKGPEKQWLYLVVGVLAIVAGKNIISVTIRPHKLNVIFSSSASSAFIISSPPPPPPQMTEDI